MLGGAHKDLKLRRVWFFCIECDKANAKNLAQRIKARHFIFV